MKDHIYKIPEEHVYSDLDKLERIAQILTMLGKDRPSDNPLDEHYRKGIREALDIVKYFM